MKDPWNMQDLTNLGTVLSQPDPTKLFIIGGGHYLIRFEVQIVGQAPQDGRLVLDDQDTAHEAVVSKGIRSAKVLPSPGVLRTVIVPKWAGGLFGERQSKSGTRAVFPHPPPHRAPLSSRRNRRRQTWPIINKPIRLVTNSFAGRRLSIVNRMGFSLTSRSISSQEGGRISTSP